MLVKLNFVKYFRYSGHICNKPDTYADFEKCLLGGKRGDANFKHSVRVGYLNFINGPISRVLLLILVHEQLLSCLFFCLLASLQLQTMSLDIAQQFMKEMVKIYFGLLEIQVKFLIN